MFFLLSSHLLLSSASFCFFSPQILFSSILSFFFKSFWTLQIFLFKKLYENFHFLLEQHKQYCKGLISLPPWCSESRTFLKMQWCINSGWVKCSNSTNQVILRSWLDRNEHYNNAVFFIVLIYKQWFYILIQDNLCTVVDKKNVTLVVIPTHIMVEKWNWYHFS